MPLLATRTGEVTSFGSTKGPTPHITAAIIGIAYEFQELEVVYPAKGSHMKYLIAALSITVTFAFAACGNKSDEAAPPAPPPTTSPPPIGGGPTGPTVTAQSCQVGQVFSTEHGCMFTSERCSSNEGWIPGQFMCAPGTLVTEEIKYGRPSVGGRFIGTMTIINQQQFNLLLRYSGRCEPYQIGIYLGSARCSHWTSQGYIQMNVFGPAINGGITDVNLTIGAGSTSPYGINPYGNSQYYWNNSNLSLTVSQQARVFDYNNSQGMQIVAINYSGQDLGLRMVIESGRLSSSQFQAAVYFQGVHFATVNFRKI